MRQPQFIHHWSPFLCSEDECPQVQLIVASPLRRREYARSRSSNRTLCGGIVRVTRSAASGSIRPRWYSIPTAFSDQQGWHLGRRLAGQHKQGWGTHAWPTLGLILQWTQWAPSRLPQLWMLRVSPVPRSAKMPAREQDPIPAFVLVRKASAGSARGAVPRLEARSAGPSRRDAPFVFEELGFSTDSQRKR